MVKTGELHFKIGSGLSELIRDAFWYEQRFDWAKETLRCFRGITVEQTDDILRGDAHFEPIDGGKRVVLLFKEDKKFKKDLVEHISFIKKRIEGLDLVQGTVAIEKKIEVLEKLLFHYDELFGKKVVPKLTTNVGGYEVPNSLLDEYINDVVRRLRMSIKTGSLIYQNPITMLELEERRQMLHERILEAVGFGESKRKGKEFQEFARALEEFLEDMGAGL